jgi:hypothetical protein
VGVDLHYSCVRAHGRPHIFHRARPWRLTNLTAYLIDRMKGQSIYAHINLTKGERSALADLASNLL